MDGWGAVDERTEHELPPDRGRTVASVTDVHRQYAGAILAVVLAVRGPRVDAEAVVQEAFVRAHDRWETVGRMDRPDLWIQRVALNLATSQLRRLAAEGRALRRLAGRRTPTSAPDSLGDDAFWRAVQRLAPQRARVVALRYAGDLTVADIAQVLDLAEGTVKAHLHQARHQLATWLAATDDPEVTS